jgi:uncharacterized membrane protein
MRKVVDAAEARATLLRTKATALLGIVAIVTPLLSWWLASGRDRLANAGLALAIPAYCLTVLAGCCLALSLLAVFRTQRVVSFPGLTLHHLVDLQTGQLKVHDPAAEVQVLSSIWGGIERWSDILADYLRAGQRFLGLSLIFAVLAGAMAYLQAEPKKATDTVIQASGNPAVQTGAATINVGQAPAVADTLLTHSLLVLVGAAIVVLTLYLFRKHA